MVQATDPVQALLADHRALLDLQLRDLSERVYESGRQADRQLTACATFGALTALILFGASDTLTLFGVVLQADIAASVTYLLSCAYYYRANLTTTALGIRRQALKDHRMLRFSSIIDVAATESIGGYVAEFPGYVLTSVYVKDHAEKAHFLTVAMVLRHWPSPIAIGVAGLGTALVLSGNALLRLGARDKGTPGDAAAVGN